MGASSPPPYRLRPNKAVDRELFVGLLMRLASNLKLEGYAYIGLGGPFLDDFRLIHSRIGVRDMVCVESDKVVHKRQLFNRPISSVVCINSTLEEYLDARDFEAPIIIWLDYTSPGDIADQMTRFARTIGEVPIGSIVRVTLNANPGSLGEPGRQEFGVSVGELSSGLGVLPTLHQWRLDRFRERLGDLCPTRLVAQDMTRREYGKSVLGALKNAVDKETLSHPSKDVIWALSTHYSDGQPMVTAAVVVCDPSDSALSDIVKEWEFRSTPDSPHLLDIPALSTRERLIMELDSTGDLRTALSFDLPKSDMGGDPVAVFEKFYRIFPHYARVDL
jgi:hypothetical protein